MREEPNGKMIQQNLPTKRQQFYYRLLIWASARLQDRSPEWMSSLFMIVWGVSLMLPGNTLDGPQYAAFKRFGFTEDLWAFVFLGFGVARLTALYVNGRWPRGPLIRIAGSIFGAISWLHVSNLLYDAGWAERGVMNTGTGVYFIVAVFDFLGVLRAAVDVRYKRKY
ncbi:MAG: hypothetical protein V4773_28145 [Verrucomicrobiota bacterium]